MLQLVVLAVSLMPSKYTEFIGRQLGR